MVVMGVAAAQAMAIISQYPAIHIQSPLAPIVSIKALATCSTLSRHANPFAVVNAYIATHHIAMYFADLYVTTQSAG